ncbi:MAG: ArsA-related P-loop ATPase [Polyangia bacterium]|jgi:anion-transporting  ArsA/GET3 family ATPase|nr:ArsA-related P-loop ATPase [Polyangia bacterium]
MTRSDLAGLLERRLLIVTGKGGVGKTTVAAALALLALRQGKRVLLAQFESNVDAGLLLGKRAVGPVMAEVQSGLHVVNMTPTSALREYGMLIFRVRAIQKAVMENRMVKHFLRAIPGLDDYSLLGKVWHHTTELSDGRHLYDLVIADGPSTGQMLRVLKVPRSILATVPDSMLARDARTIQAFLTQPSRCGCIVTTLAEELPVTESLELERALRDDLGMDVPAMIVNGLYPRRRSSELTELTAGDFAGSPRLASLYSEALIFARRRAINDEHLAMLGDRTRTPLLRLPRLFAETIGPAELSGLADRLGEGIAAAHGA